MRRLLFLDFDGVLHTGNESQGRFSNLPMLEEYLLKMPDVEIVISSSWRESRSLKELRKLFSQKLHARIVGVTPVLECGFDFGGRQREIEAFLRNSFLDEENISWVALDDHKELFDEKCPGLIWVDSSRAFGEFEGLQLINWHKSTEVGQNDD